MNTPEQALEIVAKPGQEFHAMRMRAHLEGYSTVKFVNALRKLQRDGRVEFTGKLCTWRRKN